MCCTQTGNRVIIIGFSIYTCQPLFKIFLDIGDNFPGFSRVFRDDGSAMELYSPLELKGYFNPSGVASDAVL